MNSIFFPNNLIFDRFFDDFFRNTLPTERYPQTGFPVVDVFDGEDGSAILEFALAGYKAEDLKVSVEGSKLTVSSDGAESSACCVPRRIAKRKFVSSYTDHKNVYDLKNLAASFVDGILRIEIPKKEEAQPKVFEIEVQNKKLKA